MENALKIFEYGTWQVCTFEKDGEAWFVAKDVAEALGYANIRDALRIHVEAEDKIKVGNFNESRFTTPLNGLPDNMTLINEPGVYSLIFSSKLPSAKQFKHWVTHEVLPDIRKHGMYMSDKLRDAAKVNPEVFNAVVSKYLAEKEKVNTLENYIEKNKAYTLIGQIVTSVEKSLPIADAATMCAQHGYDIGRNRVYKLLRNWDFVCSQKRRRNKPTQKGVEQGIVNLELTAEGNYIVTTQTTVTPKGMQMILDFLQEEQRPLEALWEAKEKE